MMKKVFRVDGMHCPNCAMRVEAIEDELAGVRRVDASYQKGQMVVEYDESQVSDGEIIAAVKQLGYQALPAAVA
jgi:copper chaperone CopZ